MGHPRRCGILGRLLLFALVAAAVPAAAQSAHVPPAAAARVETAEVAPDSVAVLPGDEGSSAPAADAAHSADAASYAVDFGDAAHRAPRTLRVGGVSLVRCSAVPAYCGRLDRPLDPTGSIPDRISIYFEFYPHGDPGHIDPGDGDPGHGDPGHGEAGNDGPGHADSGHGDSGKSRGTLVATEGGPGYAATGSREDYIALWTPLRASWDLLIMDNRGTGKSGALDCRALQSAPRWTVDLIAECGRTLGSRSALYSTAYAADDLAALLDQLAVGRIDLYGDSYGTYFEQVFAVRHPQALRSIVLDGAYPLGGADYAWYPTYAPAMRAKFDIACRRSPNCAQWPGTSIEHILPVIAQLRSNPFPARAVDSDGAEHRFTADAPALAIVMFGSAPALATVKEVDAAARAFLTGDRAPLLRLMAETASGVDSRDPLADPTKWSAGLAAAVMCQDAPQIFDMRLPPALRAVDRDRAVAERRRFAPDTYAPFTIDEYRAMPLDYSFLDQCVAWPVAPPGHPASQVVPTGAPYPDVPALIISGELDNMTTVEDGAAVARAFEHGRQLVIANSLHVNALPRARSRCAADIVRRFIATGEVGDTSCADRVPPVRLVPRFAVRADQLDPAIAVTGNAASRAQLQLASAAAFAAGDVLTRLPGNSTGRGRGLRGGTFAILDRGAARRITLAAVRWTDDLAVSGTIDLAADSPGIVQAHLDLAAGTVRGHLEIRWDDAAPDAQADIQGRIGAAAVAAHMPAP
jgi:pimeloyl-ACP methyl ester carboxylesterase